MEEEVKGSDTDNSSVSEEQTVSLKYRDKKEVLKGGVLGAFIGLAIIVPGVSGSAVAMILHMYEKLLYALGNLLKKFKVCLPFLLPIAIGAVLGIVVGFFGVRALLNVLPFAVVALFAGLMFGAFPAVGDQIKSEKRTPLRVILFVAGALVPIALSLVSVFAASGNNSLEDLRIYHYIAFLVLGYAVAITQLVPGLSATALLMIFGYFTPLMNSVSLTYWQDNPQIFIVYGLLIVGFVAGLLTVSKAMSRLLDKRRAPAMYTVAGLSLGSALSMFFNPEIYAVYESWSAGVPVGEIALGVVLFVVGVAVAYLFVRYERGHTQS